MGSKGFLSLVSIVGGAMLTVSGIKSLLEDDLKPTSNVIDHPAIRFDEMQQRREKSDDAEYKE